MLDSILKLSANHLECFCPVELAWDVPREGVNKEMLKNVTMRIPAANFTSGE